MLAWERRERESNLGVRSREGPQAGREARRQPGALGKR